MPPNFPMLEVEDFSAASCHTGGHQASSLFEQEIGKILLENQVLKLFTFNPEKEVITRWID